MCIIESKMSNLWNLFPTCIIKIPYGCEGGMKNTTRSPRAEGEARSPQAKGWYF